ncbi:hypothetical protein ACQR5W_11755 [Xanthomonas sacchari]
MNTYRIQYQTGRIGTPVEQGITFVEYREAMNADDAIEAEMADCEAIGQWHADFIVQCVGEA